MKRKYVKKSEYWSNISKTKTLDSIVNNSENDFCPPATQGDPFYVSEASYSRCGTDSSESTMYRENTVSHAIKSNRYANIRNGLLPFQVSRDGYSICDAIDLCQKAYANVAIFRNAIDIMSEFSNADIILEGGSKKAKEFFKKWMKYIKLPNIKDQYFREYYRSGNVFFYKIQGSFTLDDFEQILKSNASENEEEDELGYFGSISNLIPIQYILLNPYFVVGTRSNAWRGIIYHKILSEYEIERLQNPKTERDRIVFNTLDEETQKRIASGGWNKDGIKIKLDPKNLIYSFYKKQDYEPFAVPLGFSVLDDINFKLELKKIDQAIARTIENVILLITMGNEPTKGGINYKNIQAMQELLKNGSVGRTLVADYTTTAQFIIPDMNKVLGYEKYKIVNEDIKEGLQNILIGSEKFANTAVKAQVFFERLREARTAFINDFLQPEMDRVFKNLGFKGVCPVAKFEEISIKDETQFNRVVTRLMELGILTPETGIKVIETGIYPTQEELEESQKKFVENRKQGYYNPMIGGVPFIEAPESDKPPTINRAPKETGRPTGVVSKANVYSKKAITQVMDATKCLFSEVEKGFKEKYKIKKLNKAQKETVSDLSEAIIVGSEISKWRSIAEQVINSPEKLSDLGILQEVQEVSSENDLPTYASALLYHSTKNAQEINVF